MSGARRMGRLRTSPARQHKRRRHVPSGERARSYMGTILPRSFLDATFAARFLAGRPTGKVRFVPDPSRLSGVLPPGARVRRPARRAVRMSGTERIANYAGQDLAASGGRAVKTVLTPARRRRVAHKGKMTAFDRAEL